MHSHELELQAAEFGALAGHGAFERHSPNADVDRHASRSATGRQVGVGSGVSVSVRAGVAAEANAATSLKAPVRLPDSNLPNPPSGAAVDARDLAKHYGDREVLSEVDLQIAPGEFVAIVGRSGCGKSTLLRLIAGLEQADSGSIAFDGATRASGAQGSAGDTGSDTRIMFQEARLLPWKNVVDNVALGLPKRDGGRRAMEALAQVGLAERANDWPAVMSGGQRQRVALARALVHMPRLLLLDEPLGALDALTRIEMQRLIEGLWLRHGFTALLVTHDVGEAIALADRVLLIEDGRIAVDQRIDLPRPRSRGQAAFAEHEERILERVLKTATAASATEEADALARVQVASRLQAVSRR